VMGAMYAPDMAVRPFFFVRIPWPLIILFAPLWLVVYPVYLVFKGIALICIQQKAVRNAKMTGVPPGNNHKDLWPT
jgi:hypothetical protein